ncbi:MAG: NfeD family protein [Micromonosporaceae bacterium]
MAVVFLIIGGVGVGLVAVSFLLGELLQIGDLEMDGPFSVPTLSGFIGAFGFAAAIGYELLPENGSTLLFAVLIGLGAAAPGALLTIRLVRVAMNMRTDSTLTRQHLVGAAGVVLTPVPQDGYGEVRLRVAGQQMKFNARAAKPLPSGVEVRVTAALSETSVAVEEADTSYRTATD